MKSGVDLHRLLLLAKQKDLGFSEYFLGGMLEQVAHVESRDLPKMLKPFDLEDMKNMLLTWARQLKQVKPE